MATSPSKEPTPASDAKASDSGKPLFTPKEENILKVAWLCLKSGPPEVDLDKLTTLGGFNTKKTAANTWGVLKKKLIAMGPKTEGDEANGGETPKPKATPKKRGKKADAEADDDEGASPSKKTKKTPVKKGAKKLSEESVEEDAEEVKAEAQEE